MFCISHLFEEQILLVKTPSFVSITDAEPQKLLGAGRSRSACPSANQATLGPCSFETNTTYNNAVVRLCILEARKNTAETGKIYISSLIVHGYICKPLEKGAMKTVYSYLVPIELDFG